MILWTALPEEFVLAGLDYGTGEVRADAGRSEVWVRGASGPFRLLVETLPDGRRRVSRLLSSDPYDYLDPRFAPGTYLPSGPPR